MLFGTIFSSFEAEQYGEIIIKIGYKIRKLCLFKASHYILNTKTRSRVATRVNGNSPLRKVGDERVLHWKIVRNIDTCKEIPYT